MTLRRLPAKLCSTRFGNMMSWWNRIFPKNHGVEPTSPVVSDFVTIASTSANSVIHELTVQFTNEIKEKADKLDIAMPKGS
jgi:hypothetical protein